MVASNGRGLQNVFRLSALTLGIIVGYNQLKEYNRRKTLKIAQLKAHKEAEISKPYREQIEKLQREIRILKGEEKPVVKPEVPKPQSDIVEDFMNLFAGENDEQ